MLHTYWITAIRYLKKHKAYTAINIIGLSIGLAACLLIIVYCRHELQYDQFHTKASRIVRATLEYKAGNTINTAATSGSKLGPEAKRVFPQVEDYARTYSAAETVKVGNQVFEESSFLYADTAFFKIFSFGIVQGNPEIALSASENIVLTQSLAKKYFGNANPLGERLEVGKKIYEVSAVCVDPPSNSQIQFGLVTNFMNMSQNSTREHWWMANWVTYLLLKPDTDAMAFNEVLNNYMQKVEVRNEAGLEGENYMRFHFEPLLKVHLYSNLQGLEPNGSIRYVYMFGMLAMLILLIAATNYTNLATAQSVGRASEIGMRKTMGADRKIIFWQFIIESVIVSFFAGIIACFMAWVALPAMNQLSNRSFTATQLFEPSSLGWLVVVLLMTGFLAGVYPALFISRMKALQVMKGSFKSTKASLGLRKGLIILQFAISVFLIVYTGIMWQQLRYMQNKQLGYQKERMLILPIDQQMGKEYISLRESLKNIPVVQSVSAASQTPEFIQWTDIIRVTDNKGNHEVSVKGMPVDIGFLETLQMKLLSGRDFQQNDLMTEKEMEETGVSSSAFIINESLAKIIGWTPENAIGKRISRSVEGEVIGVVKDFHFQSLQVEVGPMVMFLEPQYVVSFMLRMKPGNVQDQLAAIEAWWKIRVPHRPFNYRFLDDSYQKLYVAESRASLLFGTMAVIAILLACLGLLGLASYTVLQRTREIGIRKVLGASVSSLIWLVAKQFLFLVLVGVIIAIPLAWFAAQQWLQDYAYRINPSVFIFSIALLLAVGLAFLTLGLRAWAAATVSPLKNLRAD